MIFASRFRETLLAVPLLAAAGCGSSGAGQATSPGVVFAASGEVLALTGYAFPPATPDDVAFVDGWQVLFDRLLVTIDKIKISDNPDKFSGDQSQTDALVAEVDGPWAVDLHRSDPSYLEGKGGAGEQAVPITTLTNQNKNGGAPFPADGTRFAFGFDIVPAVATATKVNLDAAAETDYDEMVTNQCTVLYVGTAAFKGDKANSDCYPPQQMMFPFPDVVEFKLCFKSPTTYANCQNPDNDPAKALGSEEHERGIAFESSQQIVAQIMVHTDHPFWDSILHDAPAHFDQYAARTVGQTQPATVTLEDTRGIDYTAYTDAQNHPINWRYCIDPPTDAHPKFVGAMSFDPETVPHATDPGTGLRDYYDFATYNQSTQGHLNSDGLCFVKRNYPSPP